MNTQQETIVEETPNVQQPGTLLKLKREALGLSQKQVADRLRLRVAIIRNIEDNQFDSDLVATFTRGYLRSYAKAVGLSAAEVVEAYEVHYVIEPQEQKMQSFSKKTKRDQHDSRIMLITWVIVLVIIGMSSLWWWQNNQHNNLTSSSERSSLITEQNSQRPSATVDPVLDQLPTVSELTADNDASVAEQSESESVNDSAVEPVLEVEPSITSAVTENTPVNADESNLLSMTFSADCWIQVKDATGKTLSTGVKKAGQSVNVRGETPISVILGAPEGVSVTFASEPVDLSGYTSGRVARFTLP
ncbi:MULTISPECIES: RodZ domain-containing protein [Vibrio]|uniref:RodZ domain-containing protein n=1 Tax=Vibrio TaxID=662 RepID=UPI000D727D8D|nr:MULTISPECIES: RodZ domain-containing protein [Vibrio]PXA72497.1 helix-turn-helix domain-containing protein [Vibrio sp. 11986-1-5]